MAQTNLVTRVRWEIARAFSLPSLSFSPLPMGEGPGVRAALLALSGGADSLCLAHAVITLAPQLHLQPIVAHLNHGIRGEAADADADFVQAFAAQHGVPCYSEKANVPRLAEQMNLSLETAARIARYNFLMRAADQHGAKLVAVAHHADDQAETVLHRLIRGTGLAGLRGMAAHSPMPGAPHLTLLRPLLRFGRKEIEQYCADCGLQPRHDATNDDLAHTRNRIRHELLPQLEQYNPGIRAVLARLADSATTDFEIIEYATQQTFSLVATQTEANAIAFDRAAWRNLPVGLQRATLRHAVSQLKGHLTDLKFSAIEEARDVLTSDATTGEIALLADVRVGVNARAFVIGRLEI
jgi:tRNA(Ile)-lysidine synthase